MVSCGDVGGLMLVFEYGVQGWIGFPRVGELCPALGGLGGG